MESAPEMVQWAVLTMLACRYTSRELILRLQVCFKKNRACKGSELVAKWSTLLIEGASNRLSPKGGRASWPMYPRTVVALELYWETAKCGLSLAS